MHYLFHISGRPVQVVTTNDPVILETCKRLSPTAEVMVVDQFYDIASVRVANGAVVPIGAPPELGMLWDWATLSWLDPRSSQDKLLHDSAAALSKRQQLLVDSDWTDTLSARTRLGDTLYTAWQDYRQALRDINKQPGFPLSIVWPKAPG